MAAKGGSDAADGSQATIPAAHTGKISDLYIEADGRGIWEESDNLSGLQTTETDWDSETVPADAQLAPPARPAYREAMTAAGVHLLPSLLSWVGVGALGPFP